MEGGVGHGLADLRSEIAFYLDRRDNNNNEVTEKKQEGESSKNKVIASNEVPKKKVESDKDGMRKKKISPTKKKKKEMAKKFEERRWHKKLRKLIRDVEEQKQILKQHERILNQLSDFYKTTKNKSISL